MSESKKSKQAPTGQRRAYSDVLVQGRMSVHNPISQNGMWYGRIRDLTTGQLRKFSTRLKATERNLPRARKTLVELAESLIEEASYETYESHCFEDAFREWLKLKDVRPITLKEYQTDLKGVYLPAFERLDVHEIEMRHIEQFLTDLRTKGRSVRTRRRHLMQVRSFFTWAEMHNYCLENPCVGVKVQPGQKVHHGKALTIEQAQRLLPACRAPIILKMKDGRRPKGWDQKVPPPPYLYMSVLLALYTGLRRSNITRLRWAQVDLKSRKITLPASEMKSKRPHEVPINQDLANLLRKTLKSRRKLDPRSLVLGTSVKSISKSFKSALARAELPNIRWHDLRHTFATWMSTRCSFSALQQLLGHSPGNVTLRYTHVPFEELRDAVDSLPPLIEEGDATGVVELG